MARNRHVITRLNNEEHALIHEVAQNASLNAGSWARSVLIRAAKAEQALNGNPFATEKLAASLRGKSLVEAADVSPDDYDYPV